MFREITNRDVASRCYCGDEEADGDWDPKDVVKVENLSWGNGPRNRTGRGHKRRGEGRASQKLEAEDECQAGILRVWAFVLHHSPSKAKCFTVMVTGASWQWRSFERVCGGF